MRGTIHQSLVFGILAVAATSLLGTLASVAAPSQSLPKSLPAPLTYEKAILPLFATRCLGCHGAGKAQAGLDLRTLGGLLQGGASGKAIRLDHPEKSALYEALASGRMPPSPQKLTPTETQRVLSWIRSGAKGASEGGGHWAFRPPVSPTVPTVLGAENPIDAFLLTELQKKGLGFSPEADKRTLLRRVTYDLIGLPPTPVELEAFIKDTAPTAYAKIVDRLLADPRYGERWARRWLDTAGYADSEGVLQEDRERPNAWRYRDYVIKSFNADKPYDRFLKEQIAGDEISDFRNVKKWTPEVEELVTATGFLRTAVDATRDDFNEHQFTEYQYRMLHDTQTILVSSTLGVTLQCARCHDHKYEPLSQRDYYRIQAALTGAIRPKGKLLPTNRRQIVAATAAEQVKAAAVNAAVDTALKALAAQEAALLTEFRAKTKAQTPVAELRSAYPECGKRLDELAALRAAETKKRVALTEIRALYDQDARPPPTPLLVRGEYQKPGEEIEPGIPTILADPKQACVVPKVVSGAPSTGRRMALAEWITSPTNPLTARVIVNRLWQGHFGVGIVASLDNFGRSGKPPSNPQLLDWLASDLVAGGWKLKRLQRLMVLSSAYRQSSALRPEAAALDPENHLLWRQRVQRLEAEAIRDGILSVAGTLDPMLYGAPVGLEVQGTGEVIAAGEAKGGRRSIYLQVRRTLPVTLLNVFDAPVMETNCTRRVTSATPTQALTLLNSSFMASQSVHFAQRLIKEFPQTNYAALQARVSHAYALAFGRVPSLDERRASVGFVQVQTRRYVRLGKSAAAAELQALSDFCQALLSANEFVYVD